MKDQSLIKVGDSCQVHVLIDLNDIEQMLNTYTKLLRVSLDPHGMTKRLEPTHPIFN